MAKSADLDGPPLHEGRHVGKRGLVFAVACAAVVLTGGLVRYADGGNDQTGTAATIAPASSVAARGKMTLDGREEDVQGSCSAPADGGRVDILLSGASSTTINVTLDNARPPNVSSVLLATSSMAFLYQPGTDGDAQATNDGNTYHISGTVLRYEFVSKTFEITVTCS